MSVFAQKVQAVLIDSQYAWSVNSAVAAALYVEECRAKHWKSTDKP